MVENFKTFDDYKVFEYEFAGRPLVVKTGKIAGLANGAALIHYGETTVLATATASAARPIMEAIFARSGASSARSASSSIMASKSAFFFLFLHDCYLSSFPP